MKPYAQALSFQPHAGALFPTGSVNVPAGVRLHECAPLAQRLAWDGLAEARLNGDDVSDRSIEVTAFTRASRLSIVLPGGSQTGGVICDAPSANAASGHNRAAREDVIELSLLGRMVGDPVFATLLAGTLFLLLLLQIVIDIHGLGREK